MSRPSPGVELAERPQMRDSRAAAPLLARYIGDTDREAFAVALLAGHSVIFRSLP